MTLFATNIILVSAAGYAAVYGVPKEEMAQMAEKAVSFAKEKLVDFSAFVKPYVDHMVATATPHLSYMRNEVTVFASDHPTLVSTIAIIAALAIALKIACFAFNLLDRCCKGKNERELEVTGSPFHDNPVHIPAVKTPAPKQKKDLVL